MITAKLDTRQFDAALRLYYKTVPKDLAYCTNRSALNVVIKTVHVTPKSDQGKILENLNQIGTKVSQVTRGKNKGKFRKAGRIFAGKTIYKLVNFYRTKKGLPGAKRAEMAGLADKFAGRRVSSISYLRSGWIPSIKVLSALKLKLRIPASSDLREARRFKKPKGRALVAMAGLKPMALVVNHTKWSHVGADALQRGINDAAADMTKFCTETMGASAKKYSARR